MNIIYYDGECALCHNIIRVLLKLDSKKKFKFSSLSSLKYKNKNLPDSIILKLNDKTYFEGKAVIQILKNLSFSWRVIGNIIDILPTNILNYFYRLISKNRKQLFIKNINSCPKIPDHFKDRFI